MKIVFLVGILDFSYKLPLWRRLETEFRVYFPHATYVLEREFYSPFQKEKILAYGKRILKTHDTGEELLLVGHSMGGVLADAIAPRFTKSRVRGIVTIFSPHEYRDGEFARMLGVGTSSIPLVSFAAAWDLLVPSGSRHPRTLEHRVLRTDHTYGLIFSSRWAKEIAEVAAKHFARP